MKNFFEVKKKVADAFVDLKSAYDVIWHHCITCKLLKVLLDKHMIRMIIELAGNQNFTLTTGDSKRSRLRCLRNGIPLELVLAPFLL